MVGHGCFTLFLREFGSSEVLFRVRRFCLLLCLVSTGQFGALTAQLGRYSRAVVAHTRVGTDLQFGPQVSGNWEFLRGLWRAVAPLMAPWCAVGEMPTCANLNLYGGSGSRVRWHSDNEGLFGKQEESKLILSMSFGVLYAFQMETWAQSGQ